MLHTISSRITAYFVARNWVEESNAQWCLYVVEKKLLQVCFLLILLVCSILSGQFVNVWVFMLPLYLLRRRIGGWHAPYAWLCLSMTTAMTLLVLFLLGPALLHASAYAAWGLDLVVLAIAFLLPPVYPPQLHFEAEVVQANIRKKNGILLGVLLAQGVTFILGIRQVLVFSFYSVLISVLLVWIEQLKQKMYGG